MILILRAVCDAAVWLDTTMNRMPSAAAPRCSNCRRGSFIVFPLYEYSFAYRDLWLPRSFRFDVGRPHHLAPFFGFLGNVLAELGCRARQRRPAPLGQLRLDLCMHGGG